MLDVLGLSRAVLPYIVFAVSLPVGLAIAVAVATIVNERAHAIRDGTPVETADFPSREPIDMGGGMASTLSTQSATRLGC
jgi:hypothetical protein